MNGSSRPRGQKLCVRTLPRLMLTCKLLGSHSLQFELRPIRALAIESVAVAQRTTSTGPHVLLSHQLETPLSPSHLTGVRGYWARLSSMAPHGGIFTSGDLTLSSATVLSVQPQGRRGQPEARQQIPQPGLNTRNII